MSGYPDDVAGAVSDADASADPRDADLQEMLADSDEVDEMLDTSYSPPDRRPRVSFDHEELDRRLAEELPEVWANADEGDGLGDCADTDGELYDDQVGRRRAGRLVAPDEGVHTDNEAEMYASDVGIDGGAASAEEAAMHIVTDWDDELED